jgi:hypothetical protein
VSREKFPTGHAYLDRIARTNVVACAFALEHAFVSGSTSSSGSFSGSTSSTSTTGRVVVVVSVAVPVVLLVRVVLVVVVVLLGLLLVLAGMWTLPIGNLCGSAPVGIPTKVLRSPIQSLPLPIPAKWDQFFIY